MNEANKSKSDVTSERSERVTHSLTSEQRVRRRHKHGIFSNLISGLDFEEGCLDLTRLQLQAQSLGPLRSQVSFWDISTPNSDSQFQFQAWRGEFPVIDGALAHLHFVGYGKTLPKRFDSEAVQVSSSAAWSPHSPHGGFQLPSAIDKLRIASSTTLHSGMRRGPQTPHEGFRCNTLRQRYQVLNREGKGHLPRTTSPDFDRFGSAVHRRHASTGFSPTVFSSQKKTQQIDQQNGHPQRGHPPNLHRFRKSSKQQQTSCKTSTATRTSVPTRTDHDGRHWRMNIHHLFNGRLRTHWQRQPRWPWSQPYHAQRSLTQKNSSSGKRSSFRIAYQLPDEFPTSISCITFVAPRTKNCVRNLSRPTTRTADVHQQQFQGHIHRQNHFETARTCGGQGESSSQTFICQPQHLHHHLHCHWNWHPHPYCTHYHDFLVYIPNSSTVIVSAPAKLQRITFATAIRKLLEAMKSIEINEDHVKAKHDEGSIK